MSRPCQVDEADVLWPIPNHGGKGADLGVNHR